MRVAFIHNEKKIGTGAHYINDLIANKLSEAGVPVKNFYPKVSLVDAPVALSGIKNILFFYSLLEKRSEILKYDLIQGTTYTVLPFLSFRVPVVSHFGSTTRGFIESTPTTAKLDRKYRRILEKLRKGGVISELDVRTRKPIKDIALIEEYVAGKSSAVVATSNHVKNELIKRGVKDASVYVIHNAIEDYWFDVSLQQRSVTRLPAIVFLGRIGADPFTFKLKGVDRLIDLYDRFVDAEKVSFFMSKCRNLSSWMKGNVKNHMTYMNVRKDLLPEMLSKYCGGFVFLSSRYEGFSLSLVEAMSQGLIPIAYDVGVVPEIIKNGENGFIVSSNDEAEKIMRSIWNDADKRTLLSQNAVRTAEQFRASNIVPKLLNLYSSLTRPL